MLKLLLEVLVATADDGGVQGSQLSGRPWTCQEAAFSWGGCVSDFLEHVVHEGSPV